MAASLQKIFSHYSTFFRELHSTNAPHNWRKFIFLAAVDMVITVSGVQSKARLCQVSRQISDTAKDLKEQLSGKIRNKQLAIMISRRRLSLKKLIQ
jgi:hypothetical protein